MRPPVRGSCLSPKALSAPAACPQQRLCGARQPGGGSLPREEKTPGALCRRAGGHIIALPTAEGEAEEAVVLLALGLGLLLLVIFLLQLVHGLLAGLIVLVQGHVDSGALAVPVD